MGLRKRLEDFFDRWDPADQNNLDRRISRGFEKTLEKDTGGFATQTGLFAAAGLVEGLKMYVWRPRYGPPTTPEAMGNAKEALLYHGGDFFDGVMYTMMFRVMGGVAATVVKEYAQQHWGERGAVYRAADWCERHIDGISVAVGGLAILLGETLGQGGDVPDYLDMPAGFLGVAAARGAQLLGRYLQRIYEGRSMPAVPQAA
jgi:hypothetical protein